MAIFHMPDVGEASFLGRAVNERFSLRLYKNDVLSGLDDDAIAGLSSSDFTAADFTGYASAIVETADWTTTGGQPTVAVNLEKTFTCTANITVQQVYGYWLVSSSSGELRGFRQFDAPVPIEFNGDQIKITPAFHLSNKGDLMPTGTISHFGGSTAPAGYLLCDGAAVSRTVYANLFAVIGTFFGSGDGSTTFNVPDSRQKFYLNKAATGTGSTLGGSGGAIDHNHSLEGSDGSDSFSHIQTLTAGYMIYNQKTVNSWNYDVKFDPDGASGGVKSAFTGSTTGAAALGGSTADENPPYLVVNSIIKT